MEDYTFNQFGQMTSHTLPDNGSGHRRMDVYTYYDAGDQLGYLKDQVVDAPAAMAPPVPPDLCPAPSLPAGPNFALTTTFDYDRVGNVISITDPNGHPDPVGHVTLLTVNQLDQVIRTTSREVQFGEEPTTTLKGYQTDTFYDANDNVARVDIQNVDEAGAEVKTNKHFTTIYEYDIINYMTRHCEEVGEFTVPVPMGPALPTCDGLPPVELLTEFITTEYVYDGNRNQLLQRMGEVVEGRQVNNAVRTLYDERDLPFQITRGTDVLDPVLTQPGQSTTQIDYDHNKNPIRISQGIEDSPRIAEFAYDGFDRSVSSTDPMGNINRYNYDANSNVVAERHDGEVLDVLGGSANDRLTEATRVYDELDRLTRSDIQFFDTESQAPIDDGESTTVIGYTDNSQLLTVTNDNNHATTIVYDTVNRRRVVTDARGNTLTHAYDKNSNLLEVLSFEKSDVAGASDESFTTSFNYDNLDRLVTSIDNVGNTNTIAYDSRDNNTRMIDALGNVVRYAYDGINRRTRTTRELRDTGDGTGTVTGTIVTSTTWDDTSRVTGRTDDSGNTESYVYDALNRLIVTRMEDGTLHQVGTGATWALLQPAPDLGGFTSGYDVHHNRTLYTDANGSVSRSNQPTDFDLLNRLTRRVIVPGAGVSTDTTLEKYAYDGLSRLVRAEDNDSVVARSFDSLSRVTRETLTIAKGAPDQTIGTTESLYDGVGNMLSCTYPGQRVIECSFDVLERKQQATDTTGGGSDLIARYDYVGQGCVARRDYGNGTRVVDAYDGITGIPNPSGDFGVKQVIGTRHTMIGTVCAVDADCPNGNTCDASSGSCVIDDRTYTWDRVYNKTQRNDVRVGGPQRTHAYTYDSIYRLIHSVKTPPTPTVGTTSYALDGVGNRTTVTGGSDPGVYTMDPTTDPATHEPADRQCNQYTTTPFDGRTYDRNGNLISIDESQPTQIGITYDYRNQMVEYDDAPAGRRHTYAYDALGRRIARTIDADSPAPDETRYFYNGWRVCEEQDAATATQATYVYGLYIDEVLSMQRGGADHFYHTDDLYNVMALTDATGNVVERYDYEDYGRPLDENGTPIAESAIGNPYLFTGRRYDPECEWYYDRTRYPDPSSGRFTTRDVRGV